MAFFDGLTVRSDSTMAFITQRVRPVLEQHVAVCRCLAPLFKRPKGRRNPARVLVLDAGAGVFAVWAASLGCSVVALDMNPRALWRIRENAANNRVAGNIEAYSSFEEAGAAVRKRFDLVFVEPPFVVGSAAGLRFLPPGYLAADEDNVTGQVRLNGVRLEKARRLLATGGRLCAILWQQAAEAEGSAVAGFDLLDEDRPVAEFLAFCAEAAPRLSQTDQPRRFAGTLARRLRIEPGVDLPAPWRREWSRARDIEAQLFARTTAPLTIPAGSYFVEDYRPGSPRGGRPRTAGLPGDDETIDVPQAIRNFGNFVASRGYLSGLFTGVLLDAAPYYVGATEKSLNQTLALWCSRIWSEHGIPAEVLRLYLASITANIDSGITLFLHPHRFFNVDHWKTIHSSFVGNVAAGVPAELPDGARRMLDVKIERHRRAFSKDREAGFGVMTWIESAASFAFYQDAAEKIKASIGEEPAAKKRDEVLKEIGEYFLEPSSEGPHDHLHAVHLAASELSSHWRFRQILAASLAMQAPASSRLCSLPLAIAPSRAGRAESSAWVGREALAFRGGAWLWLFATSDWTRDHETAADAMAREMSLLLDSYFFDLAATKLAEFERDLVRTGLSHEGQNIIRQIHKGWVMPATRILDFSPRAAAADESDKAGILFDAAPDGQPYPWRTAADVGFVPFMDLFQAAGSLLLSWLPQDNLEDLPFYEALSARPISFEELAKACWIETRKIAVVHFLNLRISSESGLPRLSVLGRARHQLEFLLDLWQCYPACKEGLPRLGWEERSYSADILPDRYTLWFSRIFLLLFREAMQHGAIFSPVRLSLEAGSVDGAPTIEVGQLNGVGDLSPAKRRPVVQYARSSGLFANDGEIEDTIKTIEGVRGRRDPGAGRGETLLQQCLKRFPHGARLVQRGMVSASEFEAHFVVRLGW